MNITDVRVRKVNDEGKMKAVVSITFDDEMGEGDFRDIAHPLLSETRNRIKDAIFAEYEKVLAEKEEEAE